MMIFSGIPLNTHLIYYFLCSEIVESVFCHGHTYLGMLLEMQILLQQTLTFTVKRKARQKSSILKFGGPNSGQK